MSWDAVNNATRYRVYRSESEFDPDPAYRGEVEAPTAIYDDTTAAWGDTEGVHYFYFVTALHAGSDTERSDYSEPAEGWRGIGIPETASASDGTNTTGVNVSWSAVTGATHYSVYRSVVEDDPAPTLLETVAAPSSGYTDNTAEHDTLYWYSVSALYNGDEGAKSADDSGYRGLAPPLNVQASDDLEDTIEITWDAVTGATGYIIYRSETETGTYTQIGTDDASPYTDGPFDPDTTRWYKLEATNSLATSAFSAVDEGRVPVWHIVTVDERGDNGCGQYTSLAIVNGNPAISYYGGGDLRYVRATDTVGSDWGSPKTPDSAEVVGTFSSLCVVNGNPAISYLDYTNKDLKYVRASDADGASWGAPLTVDSTGAVGYYTSLEVVDGNPAISYYHHDDFDGNLKYIRASDASGGNWGVPVTVDSAGDMGLYTSLVVVNGNPAISYYDETNDDLKYVRADDASGGSWGTPVTMDSVGRVGSYTSLAVVNGNPAISYWDVTNEDLKYVRASDASGDIWGTPVTVDSAGDVGNWTSLAVIGGRPAISYMDVGNYDLKYVRANDANGSSWGTPVTIESAGDVGSYTSLIEINGHPAISYHHGTNNYLKFAICY